MSLFVTMKIWRWILRHLKRSSWTTDDLVSVVSDIEERLRETEKAIVRIDRKVYRDKAKQNGEDEVEELMQQAPAQIRTGDAPPPGF